MTTRMERVEETLRRGVADALLVGGLRDPRLHGVQFSVTGVKVDADLTLARVFVDILGTGHDEAAARRPASTAAPAVRHELRGRVQLRRIPQLRFERDPSIERGLKIEQILSEIRAQDSARPADDPEPKPGE
jgi:ribosome-binding factor A